MVAWVVEGAWLTAMHGVGPTSDGGSVMSTMIDNVKSAPLRTTEGVKGWWDTSRTFLTEVRNEMRRVTWPSRREVYATTLVVILTSAFFGLYLWGLDLALGRLVHYVYSAFGVS